MPLGLSSDTNNSAVSWQKHFRAIVSRVEGELHELVESVLDARRQAERAKSEYESLRQDLLAQRQKVELCCAPSEAKTSRSSTLSKQVTVVFVARGVALPIASAALLLLPTSIFPTMLQTSLAIDRNEQGHILIDRPPESFSVVLEFLRLLYRCLTEERSASATSSLEVALGQLRPLFTQRLKRLNLLDLLMIQDETEFCAVEPLLAMVRPLVSEKWLATCPFHDRHCVAAELIRPNEVSRFAGGRDGEAGAEKIVCMDTCNVSSSGNPFDEEWLVATGGSSGKVSVASTCGRFDTVSVADAHGKEVVSAVMWCGFAQLAARRRVDFLLTSGLDGMVHVWVIDPMAAALMRVGSCDTHHVGGVGAHLSSLMCCTLLQPRSHLTPDARFVAGHEDGTLSVWVSRIESKPPTRRSGGIIERLDEEWEVRFSVSLRMESDGLTRSLRQIVVLNLEGGELGPPSPTASGVVLLVASGSSIRRLHGTGNETWGSPLEAHQDSVRCLAISHRDAVSVGTGGNSKYCVVGSEGLLASGCRRGHVVLWSLEDCVSAARVTPLATTQESLGSWIADLQFHPHHEAGTLCAAVETSIVILRFTTNMHLRAHHPGQKSYGGPNLSVVRRIATPHSDVVRCIRWLKPLLLVAASYDGHVLLWDETSATLSTGHADAQDLD